MTRAVLSVGSNMGDTFCHLRHAYSHFKPYLIAASPIYQTAPWGVTNQSDFLNAVFIVNSDEHSPQDWLNEAQECENNEQRVRTVKWGPRSLDVDIVACGNEGHEVTSSNPTLTIPHPQAHRRGFVLIPWMSIEPHAQLGGRPILDLIASLAGVGDVVATDYQWSEEI